MRGFLAAASEKMRWSASVSVSVSVGEAVWLLSKRKGSLSTLLFKLEAEVGRAKARGWCYALLYIHNQKIEKST